MLKKLMQLLGHDVTGRMWTEESEHPYFGKMVLFAFKSTPNSYWETTIRVGSETIEAFVNAPDRSPPSHAQVVFAREFLGDPDRFVSRALPLVAERYRALYGRSLPPAWRNALRLTSFEVPAGGDPMSAWSLSLEAIGDSAGHEFTCRFEAGRPESVTAEG